MIVPQFNLEWMDPPSPAQAAYEPVLRELKARPGKWARVQKDRSTTSGTASWAKLGCEAKAHRTNPGEKPAKYDIYVRWPELKTEPRPVARPALPNPKVMPIDHGKIERASREAEAFAAARAARGVGPDGKPVTSLQQR
jgi:hypothetical protein